MNWVLTVTEKQITTDEVKQADAAFFCGTAAEVIGWESFDNTPFKKQWSNTLSKQIQEAYAARVIEKPFSASSNNITKDLKGVLV